MVALICLVWFSFAGPTVAQQADSDIPETFLLNREFLKSAKQKMKDDPQITAALKQLIADADIALKRGPYSVVDKKKTPPSGDKHDYMSIGPYWWPDSSKADGLPYIRKDGQTNPERFEITDNKYYNALCNDVHLLGLAWFYTHDRKYADHAGELLNVWYLNKNTRMNPHLNYGQGIPGRTEGRGIGLIDTHGVTKLIDGIQLLKTSPGLSAADYDGLRQWHQEFLDWMTSSEIGLDEADQPNNHGTWYDAQTVALALFTGQPALARTFLEEQTKVRIAKQLEADGSQPLELSRTRSWNYATMNLRGFFELALLAENVQVDLWNYASTDGRSLKKAFLWLLPYAAGKKEWEYVQIHPVSSYSSYLALAKVAQQQYPDLNLRDLWRKHRVRSAELLPLTNWTY